MEDRPFIDIAKNSVKGMSKYTTKTQVLGEFKKGSPTVKQ